MSAAATLTRVVGTSRISSLDEVLVEYICSVVCDAASDRDALVQLLAPLLVSAGTCPTLPDALALCQTLMQQLVRDQVIPEFQTSAATVADLKMAPITLAKLEQQQGGYSTVEQASANYNVDLVHDDKKKKKKAKRLKQEEEDPYAGFAAQQCVVRRGRESVRDVRIDNFALSFHDQELIKDSSLLLSSGRRYGLIGRNGSGKTTLMRHLAHRQLPVPSSMSILYIEQEVAGTDQTVLQCCLETDVEREQLLKEERELLAEGDAKSERLAAVYQRLAAINADAAPSRASAILSGLQFTPEMQTMETRRLSGGWRMRLALARALFCEPDLLLLDEPTNHLDLHAVVWLEDYLQNWPKTLLVVSHAREFLNATCTDILHLYAQHLESYRGSYYDFERLRAEKLRMQRRAAEAQVMQKKHLQSFIDRFRYKTKTAKMAQSRIKMLEKMKEVSVDEDEYRVSIAFPEPGLIAPPILAFQDVSFGYAEQPDLFQNVSLSIDLESRVAIVGCNGAGKSTLLNLMAGEIEPSAGHVIRHPRLRLARFTQHHVDTLDLSLTPIELLSAKFPTARPHEVREQLGRFGIGQELAAKRIRTLSGGQKSRVAFSVITWTNPHVLLLDEPTNHLDMETVEALVLACSAFQGGIVLVSHDQYLCSAVCDEIWNCTKKDGRARIRTYMGDFNDYKREIEISILGEAHTTATH